MDTIQTTIKGVAAIGAVQLTPDVIPNDHTDVGGIIQIIVQVVIGIATLFHLFKNKNATTN